MARAEPCAAVLVKTVLWPVLPSSRRLRPVGCLAMLQDLSTRNNDKNRRSIFVNYHVQNLIAVNFFFFVLFFIKKTATLLDK